MLNHLYLTDILGYIYEYRKYTLKLVFLLKVWSNLSYNVMSRTHEVRFSRGTFFTCEATPWVLYEATFTAGCVYPVIWNRRSGQVPPSQRTDGRVEELNSFACSFTSSSHCFALSDLPYHYMRILRGRHVGVLLCGLSFYL